MLDSEKDYKNCSDRTYLRFLPEVLYAINIPISKILLSSLIKSIMDNLFNCMREDENDKIIELLT